MPEDASTVPVPSAVRRGIGRLAALSVAVAAAALLGLVAVQGWQVFARYVLNDSPSWTEPATILLLSTATGLGAAAGVHANRHFGFFLLAEAMRPAARRVADGIACAVVVAIGGVLAYWAAILLFDGLDVRMAGAPLPQSIAYLPLSLGGLLMVLFALDRYVATLAGTGEAR